MTCADREAALALFASEDLDDGAAAELRCHLEGCGACRAHLEEFRTGIDWLRARRHAPVAPRLGEQLQARLDQALTRQSQVPWPFTLVRRLLDALPRVRLHHESLVAGLAGALLLIGAVGALERPISGTAFTGLPANPSGSAVPGGQRAEGVREGRARDEHDLAFEAELAANEPGTTEAPEGQQDGQDGTDWTESTESTGPEDSAEPSQETATALASDNGLRIELQTRDPDVRIIWFAGAPTP